jgi:hypothetical protein
MPWTARLAQVGTGNGCCAATRPRQGAAAPPGSQSSTAARLAARLSAGDGQRAGASQALQANACMLQRYKQGRSLEAAFPSRPPPRPCRPRTWYHAAGQSTSRHSMPFMPGSGPIASFHSWGATSLLTVSMGTPLATELTCTRREVGAGGRRQGEARSREWQQRMREPLSVKAVQDVWQPEAGAVPTHETSQCQQLAWLNRQPPPTHHVWPHGLVPGQAAMPPGHCLLHRRHILSLPAQPASAVREPGQSKLAGRRIKQASCCSSRQSTPVPAQAMCVEHSSMMAVQCVQ